MVLIILIQKSPSVAHPITKALQNGCGNREHDFYFPKVISDMMKTFASNAATSQSPERYRQLLKTVQPQHLTENS